MKTGKRLFLVITVGWFLSLSVFCQKVVDAHTETAPPIMGAIEGRTYTNELLKFELTLPEEGVILNRAEIEVYKNAGIDNLKNGRNDAQFDETARKEVIILNYARKPVGSPDNSVLVIGALKQNAGVTSPMIVAETLRMLSLSGKFDLSKSLTGVQVGGLKADGLEGVLTTSNGAKVRERILILVRNGYSVSFALCGADDNAVNSAQDLLSALRFLK